MISFPASQTNGQFVATNYLAIVCMRTELEKSSAQVTFAHIGLIHECLLIR